ncbi:MAG: hypothetical protein IPK26_07385 [Planctomycetes bacterium]|nr:hypothetical protein [Planctomycetota bacterium]
MNTFACRALLAFLGGIASAQSPLTTFLASNNGGNVGGAVLFDLAVVAPLTITAIDINSSSMGVSGTLEVRICPATRVGNEMNPSVWTIASTGNPLVTQGSDAPTPCPLSPPIQLAPGTYGVLLKADTWAHRYTNGIGSNQVHANNELTLTAGAAQNTVFTTLFQPRVFNGSLHYVIGPDVAIGTPYGRGCYEHSRSFYERFPTSAAFDLANSAMTLVFTGSQYVGIGAGTWRAPTAAATTLAVSTVAEATVVLPRPLPFPGGTTSQLVVHPFGFVSTAVGNPGFTIDVNAWLQSPSPRWGDWQTLDPICQAAVRCCSNCRAISRSSPGTGS